MKQEDLLSINMRQVELNCLENENKKKIWKKKNLLKSNNRLQIKYENAALKIQNYWKHNYIIKKRLYDILHAEELRTYNSAFQTNKVKYEKIKHEKELKESKKKKIEMLQAMINIEKDHYRGLKIQQNRENKRKKLAKYQAFRDSIGSEVISIANDRLHHFASLKSDYEYIKDLKKQKLDEIEYEINEFGGNVKGGYVNYDDVDEINVHDKSMFFGE